jgi:hypothetical protein
MGGRSRASVHTKEMFLKWRSLRVFNGKRERFWPELLDVGEEDLTVLTMHDFQ